MDNLDLKYIKKHYGEKMARMCRSYFSTILDEEGLMVKILESNFAHTRHLADDLEEMGKTMQFKRFILRQANLPVSPKMATGKSVEQLFDEAGYILYPECKTEEDVLAFKKYYYANEALCTFKEKRLESCRVWFAVKKNVDQIKRENFTCPKRQDEYGTSVISIQFDIGDTNWLSIKNRYNHAVTNPDCTFSNDLDNIMPGLNDAFEKQYGLKVEPEQAHLFRLPKYVRACDGKYYRYNQELRGIFYCENNIIIDRDRSVHQFDLAQYVVADYFVVNTQKEKCSISIYDDRLEESFHKTFENIEKIMIERDSEANRVLRFKMRGKEDVLVTLNDFNQIIKIKDHNLVNVEDDYLAWNRVLCSIDAPNIQTIKDEFLFSNNALASINLPNLETIGDSMLFSNDVLFRVDVPKLKIAGMDCFYQNTTLKEVNVSKEFVAGDGLLYNNDELKGRFKILERKPAQTLDEALKALDELTN